MRVTAKAGAKHLRGVLSSMGKFQLANGTAFTSSASATLHVTRSLAVRADASNRSSRLTGSATVTLPRSARSPARSNGTQRSGRFVLRIGRSGSVVLRPDRYTLSLVPGRAIASFAVRVSAARNVRGCNVGSRGTLTIVDRGFGVPAGNATARLDLRSGCPAATHTWSTHAGTVRPA